MFYSGAIFVVLGIVIPFFIILIIYFRRLDKAPFTFKTFKTLKTFKKVQTKQEIYTSELDFLVNKYNYLSLQEPIFLAPDFYLLNEIQKRMYERCPLGRGNYLRQTPVKFSGSHEDWETKNMNRGLEFEQLMHEEALSFFRNHYLVRYLYQYEINYKNKPDMIIYWKGNSQNYFVVIECKHSGSRLDQSKGHHQIERGLEQLFRYKHELNKKTNYNTNNSYFLVLLIDFHIPFSDSIYAFCFKANVFFINYSCFPYFLKSIDEISVFI